MPNKQIIAMGGGGFSTEESPLLDDYILQVCGKDKPKICFIPTASGDEESYLIKFYRRFSPIGCYATDLRLFTRRVIDLEDFVCSQDIVYVGGGNTVNMLAIWRAHGLDKALNAALHSGTILAGISAGSICWFEHGITDSFSFGGELQPLSGLLGFLPGSNCPHYNSELKRRPAYQKAIMDGMPEGYAADDGVALHFIDGKLEHVVSSRPDAKGYKTRKFGGEISETTLETRYLLL
jgi:dipeptidase E